MIPSFPRPWISLFAVALLAAGIRLAPATAAPLATADGRNVELGVCETGSECAPEVPRTGRISELLREVDIAMAQFMKIHCVGAGVLAISRVPATGSSTARLIYRRGFGRTSGAATNWGGGDCGNDAWADGGDYLVPDTPMGLGSVSKFVTGSMARELVWQRIVKKNLNGKYSDPSEAKLLDPDLELLPASLLRYFDQTRADALCPPVPVTDLACATRVGCDGNGPDARWTRVTVGDLLGHSAGLPKAAPDWYQVLMPNVAQLRGYTILADWEAEHDALRFSTPHVGNMDTSRTYLADTLGVEEDRVLFLNHYDRVAGEDPLDETLTLVAGRCLAKQPASQTDSATAASTGYSNTGYAILDRVISHIAPDLGQGARYAAPDGSPELHAGSALALFLASNGLAAGIESAEGIAPLHKLLPPGYVNAGPFKRDWDGTTYYPSTNSIARPFCVWDGNSGTCDIGPWKNDVGGVGGLGLPWDFLSWHWEFTPAGPEPVPGPPLVPFDLQQPRVGAGTGSLQSEAAVLLRLLNRYYAQEKDVRMGRERALCAECTDTAAKNGGVPGGFAWVYQLVGGNKTKTLPPLDANGRFTIERDTSSWTSTTFTDASGVDFVVAVNQWTDENGVNKYDQLGNFIRFGLSKVDWVEVDRMLATESARIAGMAMDAAGDTLYWYEDGTRAIRTKTPAQHHGDWSATSIQPYALPSTRTGANLVGVAIDNENSVLAWYDDGRYSSGSSVDLDQFAPMPYGLPPGQTFEDILGIAMSSTNVVYSWYRDGTVARGEPGDLDALGVATYTLPPGQEWKDVVDMAIDWKNDDRVWTRFRDGTVAEGWSEDLAAYQLLRAPVAGVSATKNHTTIWYRSGFRRKLNGTLADNLGAMNIAEEGWWAVNPSVSYDSLIDVGETKPGQGTAWFATGKTASVGGAHLDGPAAAFSYPAGQSAATLVAVAQGGDGTVYSWYTDDELAVGTADKLGQAKFTFSTPPGQSASTIEAIGFQSAGSSGRIWTLYRDGAVSSGTASNLDAFGYWPAP